LAALDVSPAQITSAAVSGWWMAGPPSLAPDGRFARVPVGGKFLAINLDTGELRAVNSP
jgi:hypothetical protein